MKGILERILGKIAEEAQKKMPKNLGISEWIQREIPGKVQEEFPNEFREEYLKEYR